MMTNEEKDLFVYVPDADKVKMYIGQLEACTSLKEVIERVVLHMVINERIDVEQAVKRDFYLRIKPFIRHLGHFSDTTLYNHFLRLGSLVKSIDKSRNQWSPMSGTFSGQMPQKGEVAESIIKVRITATEGSGEKYKAEVILLGQIIRKIAPEQTTDEWINIGKKKVRKKDVFSDRSKHRTGNYGHGMLMQKSAVCYSIEAPLVQMMNILERLCEIGDTADEVFVDYESARHYETHMSLSKAFSLARLEMSQAEG